MGTTYTVNFNDVRQNADTVVQFKLQGADLTGSTLRMSLRNRRLVVVRTFEIGTGFTVLNPLTGEFEFKITKAVAATLPEGKYIHDLVLTDSGGDIQRIWEGTVLVKPGVTV